jgi:hypothetical protein
VLKNTQEQETGHRGSSAGFNVLLCQHRLMDLGPKAEPENKGALPYIPLQAGYRSKKQALTHIWLQATLLAALLCRAM